MATIQDSRGVYQLDQVIAVLKGGTPHPELGLSREERAILMLVSGARIETLVAYSEAVAAVNAAHAPPAAAPPAPAPGP